MNTENEQKLFSLLDTLQKSIQSLGESVAAQSPKGKRKAASDDTAWMDGLAEGVIKAAGLDVSEYQTGTTIRDEIVAWRPKRFGGEGTKPFVEMRDDLLSYLTTWLKQNPAAKRRTVSKAYKKWKLSPSQTGDLMESHIGNMRKKPVVKRAIAKVKAKKEPERSEAASSSVAVGAKAQEKAGAEESDLSDFGTSSDDEASAGKKKRKKDMAPVDTEWTWVTTAGEPQTEMGEESGSDEESTDRRVRVRFLKELKSAASMVGKPVFTNLNKPGKGKKSKPAALSAYSGIVVQAPFPVANGGDPEDPSSNYVLLRKFRQVKAGIGWAEKQKVNGLFRPFLLQGGKLRAAKKTPETMKDVLSTIATSDGWHVAVWFTLLSKKRLEVPST